MTRLTLPLIRPLATWSERCPHTDVKQWRSTATIYTLTIANGDGHYIIKPSPNVVNKATHLVVIATLPKVGVFSVILPPSISSGWYELAEFRDE